MYQQSSMYGLMWVSLGGGIISTHTHTNTSLWWMLDASVAPKPSTEDLVKDYAGSVSTSVSTMPLSTSKSTS